MSEHVLLLLGYKRNRRLILSMETTKVETSTDASFLLICTIFLIIAKYGCWTVESNVDHDFTKIHRLLQHVTLDRILWRL